MKVDYYKILGVVNTATDYDIKVHYNNLMRLHYNPKRGINNVEKIE